VIQHDHDIQAEDEEIGGDNVVWHEADKANAALIAAAPGLLAALEELLVITADHLRYQGDEVLNARAAIAQAKGGQ